MPGIRNWNEANPFPPVYRGKNLHLFFPRKPLLFLNLREMRPFDGEPKAGDLH